MLVYTRNHGTLGYSLNDNVITITQYTPAVHNNYMNQDAREESWKYFYKLDGNKLLLADSYDEDFEYAQIYKLDKGFD